jgi:hypothetical protein
MIKDVNVDSRQAKTLLKADRIVNRQQAALQANRQPFKETTDSKQTADCAETNGQKTADWCETEDHCAEGQQTLKKQKAKTDISRPCQPLVLC